MTTETAQPRDTETAQKHFEAGYKATQAYNREQAVKEYESAYTADPQDLKICFHLAHTMDMLGEDEQAIELYEKCIDQDNPPVNALINLAVLYEDIGKNTPAEYCIRQVLAADPNHPRARLYLKDIVASRQMLIDDKQEQQQKKYAATLDTPVSDFDLSVQARNGLRRMDVRTLGDLVKVNESELRASNNFTDTSIDQIKTMLAQRGLKLGGGIKQGQGAVEATTPSSVDQEGNELSMLDKSINELNLSVRARKALEMLGIELIGELAKKTEEELMGVKNFGRTSLLEIKEKLLLAGVELRQLDPAQLEEQKGQSAENEENDTAEESQ